MNSLFWSIFKWSFIFNFINNNIIIIWTKMITSWSRTWIIFSHSFKSIYKTIFFLYFRFIIETKNSLRLNFIDINLYPSLFLFYFLLIEIIKFLWNLLQTQIFFFQSEKMISYFDIFKFMTVFQKNREDILCELNLRNMISSILVLQIITIHPYKWFRKNIKCDELLFQLKWSKFLIKLKECIEDLWNIFKNFTSLNHLNLI